MPHLLTSGRKPLHRMTISQFSTLVLQKTVKTKVRPVSLTTDQGSWALDRCALTNSQTAGQVSVSGMRMLSCPPGSEPKTSKDEGRVGTGERRGLVRAKAAFYFKTKERYKYL